MQGSLICPALFFFLLEDDVKDLNECVDPYFGSDNEQSRCRHISSSE